MGKLIFEAASKLQNDAHDTRDYEYFLRCVDVVTQLLNDAVRRSRSPHGFRRTHGVPTREEMHKVCFILFSFLLPAIDEPANFSTPIKC